MADLICTDICINCTNYTQGKNKNYIYCLDKNKEFFYGQYMPCENFKKLIENVENIYSEERSYNNDEDFT